MADTTTPEAGLTLGTPLLDDAIRNINFFNGRLLTGRDLQREQEEAKARAQATASQVRVYGVRRGGACACLCASHCVPG